MDCDGIPETDRTAFEALLSRQRRPYKALLEVTQRCNNRCVHCYLDPGARVPEPDPPLDFLLRLLEALVAEECLWLSLTGGEPLLRPDFPDLYRAAKQHGFLITVFTNARLITDELADLFAQLPPRLVSVSVYGATAPVYDAVARVPGAHAQAMAGLRRLHERGIAAHIKTMALRSNVHEMKALKALADELGWRFYLDPGVTPTLDGATHVLSERLDPAQVAELDQLFPERMTALQEAWRSSAGRVSGPRLVCCQAGTNNLFVDARGMVYPCVAARSVGWPLDPADLHGSLRRIFYEHFPPHITQEVHGDFPCGRCALFRLCMCCHGWRELEVGTGALPCPFNCEVARHRARALGIPPEVAAVATSAVQVSG